VTADNSEPRTSSSPDATPPPPSATSGPAKTDTTGDTAKADPTPSGEVTAPTKTVPAAPAVKTVPSGRATPAATRPATPRPARPRPASGIAGGLAFVVALCSALIAAGSTVVAIYALDVAREAKSSAAIAMGGRSTAAPSSSVSNTGPTTAPTQPATAPPTATARPVYLIDTLQGELRLPPPEGCASIFVDIDSMRSGIDDGHELYVTSCLGAPTFRVDRAGAVPMNGPVTTPEQCAEVLAKETPGQETFVLVRSNLVMCLLTSAQEAQRQSIPQRIGILEVRSINADRSISLVISTYRVPV
jgi:hypothetical protein